jgi:hypothetical protein
VKRTAFTLLALAGCVTAPVPPIGTDVTLRDAIRRHGGEANDARRRFDMLGEQEQNELLTFLQSL